MLIINLLQKCGVRPQTTAEGTYTYLSEIVEMLR